MASVLPFDELNRFEADLRQRFPDGKLVFSDDFEDILDLMLDLFLLAYAQGNSVTNNNLSSNYAPTLDEVMQTVDAKVAGKTWRERTEEYFANGGSVDDIVRIAETETHRDANTAALDTAKRAGATSKTWVTMMDDRVRESHDYLLGQTVGIDEDFYTWDGAHAPAPGMFGIPEQDCNCRCELAFE